MSDDRQKRDMERAKTENAWVFSPPIAEGSGGVIISPTGHVVAYVFTYAAGWEERVSELIGNANDGRLS